MIHATKGLVLRAIKYSETSLIVTILTEKFGLLTYMANGVRSSKKGSNKAALFQPGALLQMEVYHQELKSIQRFKEAGWLNVYQNIFTDVIRHSVAVYLMELLHRALKQPESNPDLFGFCEEILLELDKTDHPSIVSNIPLFFTLHLPYFFGWRIEPSKLSPPFFLHLTDGVFSKNPPTDELHFLSAEDSLITSELLKVMQLHELTEFKLQSSTRHRLLQQYLLYYQAHFPEFGQLKSLDVLHQVL